MQPQDQDTICALSTPPGAGAIAVLRISGKATFSLLEEIFSKDLTSAVSHTIHYGKIREKGELIDEAVISIYRAPQSFTGEDVAEISCHGSPYIQQRILQLLQRKGCRLAEPGEFTMRAFFNKKMDLSQAEAVADLVASESKASHSQALQQMRGGFSKKIDALRQELIDFASMIELELDFSEEDVEFADRDQLRETVQTIQKSLRELIDSFSVGNAIKKGIPVAIIGVPNVGKSTLLNALLQEEKAIVSEIPGTTRDAIEDELMIKGIAFRFIDTAGLRDTDDEVEAIGVERTYDKIEKASLVLYLVDPFESKKEDIDKFLETFEEQNKEGEKKLVLVINKMDQDQKAADELKGYFQDKVSTVQLSAKDHANLDQLENQLASYVGEGILTGQETVVTNARHHNALSKAYEALQRVQEGLDSGLTGDLVALDIRNALHHLGAITGEVTTDDLLGNIFSNFCIGK